MSENDAPQKTRRPRRTKATIQEEIAKAAEEEIMQVGFSSSLVSNIMKRAKIEPPVFYNRYKNIDEFFDEFVKKYDYWFGDIVKHIPYSTCSKEGLAEIMKLLLDELNKKSVMAELLRWEIAEGTPTTERTAFMREMHTLRLAKEYEAMFGKVGVDVVALCSLVIGGIYYMSLHRDRATFCDIDLRTATGVERLKQAVTQFAQLIFSLLEEKNEKEAIAFRLRASGVDEKTIQLCVFGEGLG